MATVDDLQSQATALIEQLHALAIQRGTAIAGGDTATAAALAVSINNIGAQYNGVVKQLAELEGPSPSMVYLDHVGDVVIDGVGAGVSAGLDALNSVGQKLGSAVGGTVWAALKPLLPLMVLSVLAVGLVVYLAGKSGAVRVSKVGV